ncbi:helix-turn-helix domain-containing protein [Flavihumibacter solisilvae]|uniref:AraC family transcriptional regulator n=1 Tax=Flavihumibacter solisilvae TaxID=1349421 RepID=A0A0C1L3Q2_9BACT|nr:helix-turn-helix transcriptional regulator [Flavihumibacter solisilvae]KIC94231.1 AraC family transcriptional regulator [Flavihumibacter solisilvae]
MKDKAHTVLNSISQLHSLLKLKKSAHPLVSVIRAEDVDVKSIQITEPVIFNFYVINVKTNCKGKIKYGQHYYDFDEGVMTFVAPKQRIELEEPTGSKSEGWMLVIHPDFLHGYPIAKKMKDFGFFSYAVNEALHLSDKENQVINGIMQNLQDEIAAIIDGYTQDVVVSHIELLLNYSNRFYNRQFITRKKASSDLLVKFEELLTAYFNGDVEGPEGLPSVQYFSDKLFVSPNYLNDMLKNLTGQTTQQHIHNTVIGKAKELLSTTNLSVSEIAYQLGFEYPQSFNKLFKNKTNVTPLEFRQSFN